MSDGSQPSELCEADAANDAQLLRDLRAELDRERAAPPGAVHATVQHAVAILSGSVASDRAKAAIIAAVRRIPGIQDVHDELRIETESDQGDEQILARVQAMLGLDVAVAPDRLIVSVANGQVTIGGHVEWPIQAHAAIAAAHRVRGVRNVTSAIRVDGLPSLATVRGRLAIAFRDAGEAMASAVELALSGSCVHLSGTVHSQRDRALAEATIRALPGVTAVENHLVVE